MKDLARGARLGLGVLGRREGVQRSAPFASGRKPLDERAPERRFQSLAQQLRQYFLGDATYLLPGPISAKAESSIID